MASPHPHQSPFRPTTINQRRYLPYSIFINGSHLSDDLAAIARAIRPIAPKNVNDWLRQRLRHLFNDPPPDHQPLVLAYEKRIRVTLNAIRDKQIGKTLFQSLNPANPVWIIPYTGAEACTAYTSQRDSVDWKNGVQIQWSPETWDFDQCGHYPGYRPVESLFHEMVHASRFSRLGFDGMQKKKALAHNQDYEEFLAVMVSNSFRSEEGAKKFNRNYMDAQLGSQDEVERYLASNRDFIAAIDFFMNDPLVQEVVKLPMPFNVFRDIDRIKKI